MSVLPPRPLLLCVVLVTTACDSHHQRVKVAKLSAISVPANLADTDECRRLWGTVQRAGMEMDKFSPDWNELLIEAAHDAIQAGCTQKRPE